WKSPARKSDPWGTPAGVPFFYNLSQGKFHATLAVSPVVTACRCVVSAGAGAFLLVATGISEPCGTDGSPAAQPQSAAGFCLHLAVQLCQICRGRILDLCQHQPFWWYPRATGRFYGG